MEAEAALELLKARCTLGDAPGQTAALRSLVTAHGGPTARCLVALKDWLASVRQAGDKLAEALALRALVGALLVQRGGGAAAAAQEASRLSDQATSIYQELGDKKGQAELVADLVQLQMASGHLSEALSRAKEGVQLFKGGAPAEWVAALLRKVTVLQEIEEYDKAVRTANQALVVAQDAKSLCLEVDSLCASARVQAASGRPTEARQEAMRAADLCRKSDDRAVSTVAQAKVAATLVSIGRPGEALDVADAARALFGQVDDARGQAELFRGTMVEAHLARAEVDRALVCIEAARDIFHRLKDEVEERSSLRILVERASEVGRCEDALTHVTELVELCAGTGQRRAEADARHLAAHVHHLLGEYSYATTQASSALEIFRQLTDRCGEVSVLETLIRVQISARRVDEALEYAEKARAICEDLDDRITDARVVAAITNIRLHKQEFAELVREAKTQREVCRQRGNLHGEAQQWLATASARLEQVRVACPYAPLAPESEQAPLPMRRLMEGLMAAQEALHIFKRIGDVTGQACALFTVAKAQRFRRQPLLALEAARESTAVFKAGGDLHGAAQALLLEATTHLLIAGTPWETAGDGIVINDREADYPGEFPRSHKQALAAAAESLELCKSFRDTELEGYARQVLGGAREPLWVPLATAMGEVSGKLLAISAQERGTLEDMGFRFKSQSEAEALLRPDARLEGLLQRGLVPVLPMVARPKQPDPAMERLTAVARRVLTSRVK